VKELVEYPGRQFDCVMGLWIAWLCAKEQGPRFLSFSRLDKPIQVGRRGASFGHTWLKNPYYDREPVSPEG
jgi:hypothetical protein